MSEDREKNLKIQLNKTIIERVKEANLSMRSMGTIIFVLNALFEGRVDLLDCADDSNKQREMITTYKHLVHRGFLETDPTGEYLFRLTPIGNEFVTHLREEYEEESQVAAIVSAPVVQKKTVSREDSVVGGWITEYINLFPGGRTEGKPLRDSPGLCINKMNAFIKEYGFDKDTILQATKMYLEFQEGDPQGHTFTRTAKHFIWKDNVQFSDLAAWCQKVVDGEENPQTFDTRHMDIL